LRLAWTMTLLFYASHYCWDERRVPPHPAFLHWDGIPKTFLPRLAPNCDPPKSNTEEYLYEPLAPGLFIFLKNHFIAQLWLSTTVIIQCFLNFIVCTNHLVIWLKCRLWADDIAPW
jgi:hypothetical protein